MCVSAVSWSRLTVSHTQGNRVCAPLRWSNGTHNTNTHSGESGRCVYTVYTVYM